MVASIMLSGPTRPSRRATTSREEGIRRAASRLCLLPVIITAVVVAGCSPTGAHGANDTRPNRHDQVEAATAAVTALQQEVTNSIGMELRYVPPGEFLMGLPDAGQTSGLPPEVPAHRVRLTRGFYMGRCEVTQLQYKRIMKRNPSWHTAARLHPDTPARFSDTFDFPVEQVSWNDAVAFCKELSLLPAEAAAGRVYRLPTEAEWEYACRGASPAPHDFVRSTSAIGKVGASAEPNAFGLFNMRDNVWEWCSDWYLRDYYSKSPPADPVGPARGLLKIVRGTDWGFAGDACRLAWQPATPDTKNRYIGVRVVCDVH